MSNASIPARFTYSQWRHGGWYVNEVRYPSGAIGCVSRNYPDGKWRIVCGNHDATFPTREAAARAEFEIAAAERAAAEAAKAAPPAAPVASDPVPADVPCYLAVSTVEGVDTVMGVFRVADHASPEAAEREASKLCDRIRAAAPLASYGTRWSNGKPTETDAAFAALDAAERALAAEPVTKPVRSAAWSRAFDAREAARERAVSLDPVRFVRTYPSQAYAFRHLLPADMVARIEAAEDDAELRAAVGAPGMVPQPCQPQQGRARGRAIQPPRGERRYVTVRDTETGEMHRVLTSVARVGFAVVVFVPSNRHRQGALSGMLITHDDTRKAWVFNDEAEARHMLSRNHAPGERVIPAELVSDPAI